MREPWSPDDPNIPQAMGEDTQTTWDWPSFLQGANVGHDVVHVLIRDTLDRLHLPLSLGDCFLQILITHLLDFRRTQVFYVDFHHLGYVRVCHAGCTVTCL